MANILKEEDLIIKLNELIGNEYTFIELKKEKNKPNKMILIHNKCGKKYIVEPNKFFNKGNRCNCSIKNIKEFEIEMDNLKGKNELYNFIENLFSK